MTDLPDPWGAHASCYDEVFAPLTGYIARSMLSVAEAQIPEEAHVLDVACGSGALFLPAVARAQRARARGGGGRVTGCDFSAGMVDLALRKAAQIADPEVFLGEVQDGQALTYGDGSFDAVFSCFGIFLFEDRRAGWAEAMRVLRPGGLFATTTWQAPEKNEMFRAQFAPLSAALPPRLTADATPPGWMVVADGDALAAEVGAAGFVDVEVRPFETELVIPSAEVAWACMVDNPAAGAMLGQCTDAERAEVESAVLTSLHERTGGPGRPLVLRAACNILVARKASR